MPKTFTNMKAMVNEITNSMKSKVETLAKVDKLTIKYGVPAGIYSKEGEEISLYAKKTNFGDIHTPARPWLSTLIFRYENEIGDDIDKALDEIINNKDKKVNVKSILEKNVAMPLTTYMKKNIIFGNWVKNSAVTLAMKQGSTPLIDTGEMADNVTSFVVKK